VTVALVLALALLLGPLSGWLVFRRLAAREYQRGLLAGELQAKLLHGWHAPVDADAASVRADQPRRRSPNEQFVWRAPAPPSERPVFYR
jgi:hypothetical protein